MIPGSVLCLLERGSGIVFYDFQLEVGDRMQEVYDIFTENRPRIVFCQESLQLVIAASTDGPWGCSQ